MPAYEWDSKIKAFTKECSKCMTTFIGAETQSKAEKVLFTYFTHNSTTSDNFSSWCRDCVCEAVNGYKLKDSKANILAAQGYECPICSTTLDARSTHGRSRADGDHDHNTREFRAFLCHRCNLGMGYVDDREWLAKANAYYNFHRTKRRR